MIIDRTVGHVHAVDDVSFDLREGETLGIVGESGCGKTTLIRTLVRLIDATAGTIRFRGDDITKAGRRQLEPIRREMQMVFQDPQASLNPRKRVGQILATPLRCAASPKDKLTGESRELLERVGLSPEQLNRFPHEFSGGQRQRIGIARALAVEPAADPARRAGLRARRLDPGAGDQPARRAPGRVPPLATCSSPTTCSVVRHVSDRIAVMYLGKLMEVSPAEELYNKPIHPYTSALLGAIPIPDPAEPRPRRAPWSAASRRTRSTRRRAAASTPAARARPRSAARSSRQLTEYAGGHLAACHHPQNVTARGDRARHAVGQRARSAPARGCRRRRRGDERATAA